jgi:uncharacterized protein
MKTLAITILAWLAILGTAAADSPLANLIQAGQRAAALEMIRAGHDVNAAQGDGTTPLHWAVYRIDETLVDALLEHGARAGVANLYGSSPLAEAVKIGNARLAAKLIAAGANVDSPNEDGQTTLMLAARTGALQVARVLLEAGAEVDAREHWRAQTALMWAADARQPELTRLLLAHDADVELRANTNEWATQITSEPRAQYRPTGGLTPLLYAARSGCTPCVAAILDAGADIDRPSPDGITPLMVALDNFAFDTARLLLERGANPHSWDWWGRTPLYVAVDMSSYNRRLSAPLPERDETTALDIIDMLLAAGVDPNTQLNMHRPGRGGNSGRFVDDLLTTGATPLLRAAIGHDGAAIRALLAHGALVDLPNVMGVTPLMGAAGVGVSVRDGRLDFTGDVESRAIATLEVLLDAGANINRRITDIDSRSARIARPSTMSERLGQTALYGAVKWAWPRVVEYLVERGAEVDMVDALGFSPVDAALGKTGGRDNTISEEVAEILRRAGGRETDSGA